MALGLLGGMAGNGVMRGGVTREAPQNALILHRKHKDGPRQSPKCQNNDLCSKESSELLTVPKGALRRLERDFG